MMWRWNILRSSWIFFKRWPMFPKCLQTLVNKNKQMKQPDASIGAAHKKNNAK